MSLLASSVGRILLYALPEAEGRLYVAGQFVKLLSRQGMPTGADVGERDLFKGKHPEGFARCRHRFEQANCFIGRERRTAQKDGLERCKVSVDFGNVGIGQDRVERSNRVVQSSGIDRFFRSKHPHYRL